MPTDKADFATAQEIHSLLVDVAGQGSKDAALQCEAMQQLLAFDNVDGQVNLPLFLFHLSIAVQFGPVEDVASEGTKFDDKATWGDDTLTQADKDGVQRLVDMANAYKACHDEDPIVLAPDDPLDPNQGMT